MAELSYWRSKTLILLIAGDKTILLEQLQTWGGEYLCPNCSAPLNLYSDVQSAGGWRWLCTNKVSVGKQKRKTCDTVVAFYTGTIFEKSQTYDILLFAYFWLEALTLEFICDELHLSSHTAVDWLSFCREVVFDECINQPEKLGEPGITVEIDESKFQGHPDAEHWMFGGFERGTGRVFMVLVKDRTAETLVPLIERWIKPSTTIISDCWAADFRLNERGYNHLTVNLSLHFCDPDTGAHINHMKSSWRAVKATMPTWGCTKDNIPGYLARYMFHKYCKQLGENRFEAFLKLAAKLHNPLNPRQPCDDKVVTEDETSEDEL